MTSSKYSNFDYDLSQKMLTLLKGMLPHILPVLTTRLCRLLPRPVKEGADRDRAALVQGPLQGAQAVRAGEAAGQGVHCQHPPGKARDQDQGARRENHWY